MIANPRRGLIRIALVLLAGVVVMGWLLYFHNDTITAHLPAWLSGPLAHLGQKSAGGQAEDEDPDNTKNEIPVHTSHVSTATLHRYVEGFGVVAPRPARNGSMAGGATLVSPVAGVVSKVLCELGQKVHAGDRLLQLDDRAASAAVDQAQAALAQAEASLSALKAMPRPDQLRIAELALDKAKAAYNFSRKHHDRIKQLAADQVTAGKNLEQATEDLATAENDLAVAQRQLDILKNSPTPEDLQQENAKVAAAQAALAASRIQKELLTLKAPIDGTVAAITVNPGEAVDAAKTLVQLVALDRLMVDVDIPPAQLPDQAAALRALIVPVGARGGEASAASTQAAPLECPVSFISPQVDSKTGAVPVGIDLPADSGLRPGLAVRVRIIAEVHQNVLVVPRDAVVADENGDAVIAILEGDQATHKHVKVGLQEAGLVEVNADGLKDGDTVVTAGAYGLPQASRVKVSD